MDIRYFIEFMVHGHVQPRQTWVDAFKLEWDMYVGGGIRPTLTITRMRGNKGEIEIVTDIEKFEILSYSHTKL